MEMSKKDKSLAKFRRIRLGNEYVELAFSRGTGELLELINRKTGENLIKNHWQERSMPFQIEINHVNRNKNKGSIILGPGSDPEFKVEELSNGQKVLKVHFAHLSGRDILMNDMPNNEKLYKIGITYSVRILPDSPETLWDIEIFNGENDLILSNVMFPCVFGIYLGETWADDELVYPYIAGEKIANPIEIYAKPPKLIRWKWQDYNYIYGMDGVFTQHRQDGSYVREFNYCGAVSMMWLDYFEKGQGLYMASYDSDFSITGVHAETFGPNNPGMGFFMRKYPEIFPGMRWTSQPFAIAIHESDWHWGADRYRQWIDTYIGKTRRPQWFEKSPGLVAHYDFKYQSGDIVHTFKDIPELFEKAKNMGIDHLLLAGWHTEGFDNGFPLYRPDADLGSEVEFKEKIKDIKQQGGHISFYVNSRLCNKRLKDFEKFMEESGVMISDGSIASETYGNQMFSVMCSNDTRWQTYLKDVLDWLVKSSADGVYFDQMSMAPPYLCYSNSHEHNVPTQWNKGYINLLKDINRIYDERFKEEGSDKPALFIEGCGDAYGYLLSGQLISTFFYWHCGAYPELYKYTFPEQVLVDMIYPSKGQTMRPIHVSQISRDMLNKSFIMDSYFWIYDLEEDNTFYKDPEMLKYLKEVIVFRKFWLEHFGWGIFRDDVGLYCENQGVMAKLYLLSDAINNSLLIAVWNKKARDGERILVKWDSDKHPSAICYELGTDFSGKKLNIKTVVKTLDRINNEKGKIEEVNRFLEIPVSTKELSLIYIYKVV